MANILDQWYNFTLEKLQNEKKVFWWLELSPVNPSSLIFMFYTWNFTVYKERTGKLSEMTRIYFPLSDLSHSFKGREKKIK